MFGGFLENIQKKSNELIDIYAKDIKEFAGSIGEETKPVTQSLTQLLLPTAPLDDDEIQESPDIPESNKIFKNRSFSEMVMVLQEDPSTYLIEVNDNEEKLIDQKFDSFEFDSMSEESIKLIESILKKEGKVEQIFHTNVPENVSYEVFWKRYFFRYNILKNEFEKREKLKKLSTMVKEEEEEEELGWDDDGDEEEENEGNEIEELKSTIQQMQNKLNAFTQINQLEINNPKDKDEKQKVVIGELIKSYEEKIKSLEKQVKDVPREDNKEKEDDILGAVKEWSINLKEKNNEIYNELIKFFDSKSISLADESNENEIEKEEEEESQNAEEENENKEGYDSWE